MSVSSSGIGLDGSFYTLDNVGNGGIGFYEVIYCPQFLGTNAVFLLSEIGKDNDFAFLLFALQLFHKRESVHLRHNEIEQNHVVFVFSSLFQDFYTIGTSFDFKSFMTEFKFQCMRQRTLIFHDKNFLASFLGLSLWFFFLCRLFFAGIIRAINPLILAKKLVLSNAGLPHEFTGKLYWQIHL